VPSGEEAAPDQIAAVRTAFDKARVKSTVEVYRAAGHGFVFLLRKNYVKATAERHWETLFDLFGRTLQ
jgi:carboxymethylenebutenolidase